MKGFTLYRILFIVIFAICGPLWAAEEDHPHKSSYGGQVKTMGNYHVELLVEKDGKIKVYLLDKNTKPLSAEGVKGVVYLRPVSGGGMKTVQLRLSADKTYLEGGVNLKELPKFEAELRLTVKSQTFSPVKFNYHSSNSPPNSFSNEESSGAVNQALAAKFDYLSKNGNSACSESFTNSIPSMSDDARLRGSCCNPMSMHLYSEQVEGLKKYKEIPEIPADPYDIEAKFAKKLMAYYDTQLTPEKQKIYDYTIQHSDEKGPCCCKCWRWYVYGGLGKYLIKNYKFTGEQVIEVWNLSDGCGGDSEHHHHHS